MNEYQICTNCVMDSSDPKITFDENGVCDHCIGFEKFVRPLWKPNSEGMSEFKQKVQQVKKRAKGKEYDCKIGRAHV